MSAQTKLFCSVLLVCSVSPVWADWEMTSVEPNQVVYHDKATRAKDSKFVTMWTMTDFAVARTEEFGTFQSFSSKDVFDCTKKRHAFIVAQFHGDKLGTGNLLHTIQKDEKYLKWASIAPSTTSEKEWQIACQGAD
jgi:hypothetical protein